MTRALDEKLRFLSRLFVGSSHKLRVNLGNVIYDIRIFFIIVERIVELYGFKLSYSKKAFLNLPIRNTVSFGIKKYT